jgi:membrane fusion protein, multidrug efflux system
VNRLLAAVLLVISTALMIPVASEKSRSAEKSDTPSVLVQVTKLQKGSLPKVVTVFGKVDATAAMREAVTAPATAVVAAVFAKPGQQVNAGTALVQLGPTPETAAAYKKAVSALNNAHELVQRTQALLAQHLATRQQLADAQKAVADAQDSLNALAAEGASTPKTLSAPYDGVVTSISVSPGAIVTAGTALLAVTRTNGLVLRAGTVPEDAKEIHKGDAANVLALGGGDAANGTVVLRGSIVDSNTGLVPVEIALAKNNFLPGQTARAQIVTGTVEGYIVPHEAVLVNEAGSPYVVQAKNMIAHKVPVTILLSAGAKDVITGVLDPEAALVLAGNYQLKDGMQVRIADPKQTDSK